MDPEEDRQRLAAVIVPIGWNIDVEKKAVLAVGAARHWDRVRRYRKRDRVAELRDVLRTGSAKLRRVVGILRRAIRSWRFRRRPAANSGGRRRVTDAQPLIDGCDGFPLHPAVRGLDKRRCGGA